MKNLFKILMITAIALAFTNCRSPKKTTNNNINVERTDKRGPHNRGQRSDLSQIFAQMDTNRDGKISKFEAKGKIKENFKRRDINNNGFITKDEMRNKNR